LVAGSAAVGGGVYAAGSAGDDGQARGGEDAREAFGLFDAVSGGVSGADDGDGVAVGGGGVEGAAYI